jgi:hypothetical protein
MRGHHPGHRHEGGDHGEQGGQAHEAEQDYQSLVGFRHDPLSLTVLMLDLWSGSSDRIRASLGTGWQKAPGPG